MNRVYKRKKKKVFNFPFKFLIILVVVGALSYFGSKYRVDLKVAKVFGSISEGIKSIPSKVYAEDKEFSSKNLKLPEGQKVAENQDGYTRTFTTLNKKNQKTYKEFKQNLESASWTEKSYWGGTIRENGCGITALAIIASGYGKNYVTPDTLREEYYPHLDGDKIEEALEDLGIECTDFYYDDTYVSKKYIMDWLKTGRPVMICVGSDKENKWTTSSHYMDLLDINSKGYVYLSNPNRTRWGRQCFSVGIV